MSSRRLDVFVTVLWPDSERPDYYFLLDRDVSFLLDLVVDRLQTLQYAPP